MKLFNKKFLEFRFTVPKIKIDTNIVSITYFKSWIDLFTIRKSRIELNLKQMGGNVYKLSYDNFETDLNSGDVIMIQISHYENDLYIIVNPPIHTDQLDAENYTDVFADIWKKSDFKLWKWLNFKLGLNEIGTNFV
jgi:hypothetical protein